MKQLNQDTRTNVPSMNMFHTLTYDTLTFITYASDRYLFQARDRRANSLTEQGGANFISTLGV